MYTRRKNKSDINGQQTQPTDANWASGSLDPIDH